MRTWSHSTYWHGKKRALTEYAALKTVIEWAWKVHRTLCPEETAAEHLGGCLFEYEFWRNELWIEVNASIIYRPWPGIWLTWMLIRWILRPTADTVRSVVNEFTCDTGFLKSSDADVMGTPSKKSEAPVTEAESKEQEPSMKKAKTSKEHSELKMPKASKEKKDKTKEEKMPKASKPSSSSKVAKKHVKKWIACVENSDQGRARQTCICRNHVGWDCLLLYQLLYTSYCNNEGGPIQQGMLSFLWATWQQ